MLTTSCLSVDGADGIGGDGGDGGCCLFLIGIIQESSAKGGELLEILLVYFFGKKIIN